MQAADANRESAAEESFNENHEVIQQMRRHGDFCDAILLTTSADGRTQNEHPVHRVILAANSNYFRSLFSWPTSSSNRTSSYRIDGIAPEVLDAIIDYLYSGQVTPWLSRSELIERLVPAVDFLRVNGLIRKCCDRLVEKMAVDTVIGIHRLTTHYYFPDLQTACRRFLLRHFAEVSATSPEYAEMPVDTLCELLSDDRLCVANESDAFEAIVRWTDHDPDFRASAYFQTLFSKIRFSLMDPTYMVDRVLSHPYVKSSHRAIPFDVDPTSVQRRPRVPTGLLFAVGGWTSGNPTSFLETYDCRAHRWSASPFNDSLPRAYHGTVTLDERIYVVGGFDGRQHFSSTRCFDPTTRQWTERSCMHYPRCYVSVCVLDGKIYALGGFDGRNRINHAERYDSLDNQWTLIQSMNRPRSDASAAALQGKVYIVGGFTGEEVLSTVESYEPEVDAWTFASPMQVPRSGVSSASYCGCLYVAGGFNGFFRLTSCERFNPSFNQWTYIAYMNTPRSNFACCVLESRVYAIGGFDGDTTTSLVEEYDPEADHWTEVPSMLLDRSALSACVLEADDIFQPEFQ